MVHRTEPVRTCVGCRSRAGKTELLRVVATGGVLVPDVRARLPGRGAFVHPDAGCLDLADRRWAFPRALRLPGPLDGGAVRRHVEQRTLVTGTTTSVESEAGRDSDERSMSSKR